MYRVCVKSINGYYHFHIYFEEELDIALEDVTAHYAYFNEYHPGQLTECSLIEYSPIGNKIIKDFLKGE